MQTPYDAQDSNRPSFKAQVIADAVEAMLRGVTLRRICRELNRARHADPPQTTKRAAEGEARGVVTV